MNMRVFKFGGASVNSADAVKNVLKILTKQKDDKLLVVFSAMGKTTNAFEKLTNSYFFNSNDLNLNLEQIIQYHICIINDLFSDKHHIIFNKFDEIINEIKQILTNAPSTNYDFEYDKIVPYGEIISSMIISDYLNNSGIRNILLDARKLIITNDTFREGKVNWELTKKNITENALPLLTKDDSQIIITQGFIGSTNNFENTTLGREGSDYSAAIFAYFINAKDLTIWKDVPGLLNADPKFFNNTKILEKISYREAIELAYYGATIIHPKTIKPLQNKKIPLFVKSFLNPENKGTVISDTELTDGLIPSFIFKQNQILLSISPKDFSFIAEESLSEIFNITSANRIKINMMQNSAISFSICIDGNNRNFESFIAQLQQNYKIRYNVNLDLITIRHYKQETIDMICSNRKILLEQRSRLTAQFVVEN